MTRLLAALILILVSIAPTRADDAAPVPLLAGPPGSASEQIGRAVAAALERRSGKRLVVPAASPGALTALSEMRGRPAAAIVRADLLRDAYAGAGRFDRADAGLRALAVLHDEVVHVVARAPLASLADLRGKRVAVGAPETGDAETARAVLSEAGLGLLDISPRELDAAAAEAALASGAIDAFFAIGPPPLDPVARALAAGASLVPLGPAAVKAFKSELAYPRGLVSLGREQYAALAAPVSAVAAPAVLCASESLPRGAAEDLVEALFLERAAVVASHPAAAAIDLARAAKPSPIPLHKGAALFYERAGPLAGPIEMKTIVWIYSVSDVDLRRGTFALNATLDLRWLDPRLSVADAPFFEVMNADEPCIESHNSDTSGPWQLIYSRVNGRLRSRFDLSRYPFDRQMLELQIEHPVLSASEIAYIPEGEMTPGVDPLRDRTVDPLSLSEWEVVSVTASRRNVTYGYGGLDEYSQYSRFILTFEVKRNLLAFLLKDLLPIALMVIISLTAGFLASDKVDAKLMLTVLALLVAVELQVAHAERFPEVMHLTFADWVYILAYITISIGVIQSVVEYRLHVAGRDPAADRVRRAGVALGATVFVVPLAVLAWRLA